jgi:hypothetical protein
MWALMRTLVSDSIEAIDGETWWSGNRVPAKVKQDAESRMQREIDSGVTCDPLIHSISRLSENSVKSSKQIGTFSAPSSAA